MRAWLGEALLLLLLCAAGAHAQDADQPLLLSQERVVFQLESGDFVSACVLSWLTSAAHQAAVRDGL